MVDEMKLKKIVNFAKLKNTTKQSVYNAIYAKKLTRFYIDGEPFIVMDDKSMGWEPRRIKRQNKSKK